MDYERLFLSELDRIDRIVAFVARRYRLPASEREEFASIVRLQLIQNDYDVLRRFQGRSSLATYLTTVIQRLFLDYRARLWGKWRPSARARRLGPSAVRLEMFIYRDGLTFDQACERMAAEHGGSVDRDALEALRAKLPDRQPRRFVGEEALAALPSDVRADGSECLEDRRLSRARDLEQLLSRRMGQMPPQDRLILQLRFERALSVADIARGLGLEAKPLYRRIERLLRSLRSELEQEGFLADEVTELMGDVELSPGPAREKQQPAPSISGREEFVD